MTVAYVGLGSNLGDRMKAIRRALWRLNRLPGTRVRRRSAICETTPVGKSDQPNFLNAVAEVETRLAPATFLRHLLEIERILGRIRRERWGPRTIDLDLLLWGDRKIRRSNLEVPHPRLKDRRFALVPLSELCPDRKVPGTGRTVRHLLHAAERKRT
ncbi:MAG: 2-amino-4-hydroxy-6-hydroxymethyldihydropteridine diphosphokinase [Planctomycetes bacterium]|nr:2-amino-4-hydroxy-6-hydroxymethyldihydropteridine diphosphokinase [Planctomycetota bacterium]